MASTREVSVPILQRWNCANCGRTNDTAVDPLGFAQCEYCTDVATVRPQTPWASRISRLAAKFFSFLSGQSGCIQSQPVVAQAGRRENLTR
jgi:hypothetical protein